jgi:HipA-like protein
MAQADLAVVVYGATAGYIRRASGGAGDLEFAYDPAYVSRTQMPVSVSMPVTRRDHKGQRVRAF